MDADDHRTGPLGRSVDGSLIEHVSLHDGHAIDDQIVSLLRGACHAPQGMPLRTQSCYYPPAEEPGGPDDQHRTFVS